MIKMLRKSHRLLRDFEILNSVKGSRQVSEQATQKYPRRIFSGIQPTGNIHIGNYLGAIQKWVELQNNGEDVIWSIVDLHSITLPQNPTELRENIRQLTATLIASGIDPEKSILFQQSTVPIHTELGWILGCHTTMARLSHLPQFKEKSEKLKDIPLGLFVYPVLQAADILLYRATNVPVGQDQVQHLQLSQHLAQVFNTKFGNTFPIPRSMISDGPSQRIKCLRDPSKKMSKSSENVKGRLDLIDDPGVIRSKIKKATTDFTSQVTYDPENRPGVSNLISIHSLLTGKSPEQICKEAENLDTGKYKLVMADEVIEKLKPIHEKYHQLIKEPQYLDRVLKDGAERATEVAMECMLDVRNKIGFGNECLISSPKQVEVNRTASRG